MGRDDDEADDNDTNQQDNDVDGESNMDTTTIINDQNNQQQNILDRMEEWSRRLLDPSVMDTTVHTNDNASGNTKQISRSLTHIPWTLIRAPATSTSQDESIGVSSSSATTLETSLPKKKTDSTTQTNNSKNKEGVSVSALPSLSQTTRPNHFPLAKEPFLTPHIKEDHHVDTNDDIEPLYLTFRRQQNQTWADIQCQEGVTAFHAHEYEEAYKCYQHGLDLVPEHADLLVALAALHARLVPELPNNNSIPIQPRDHIFREQVLRPSLIKAIGLLEDALRSNPNHENAKTYLEEVLDLQRQQEKQTQQKPIRSSKNNNTLQMKSDRALKDALLERAFAKEGTTTMTTITNTSTSTGSTFPAPDTAGTGTASASHGMDLQAEAYPLLPEPPTNNDDREEEDSRRRRRHGRRSRTSRRKNERDANDSDSSSEESDNHKTKRSKKRRTSHRRRRGRRRRDKRSRSRSSDSPSSPTDESSISTSKSNTTVGEDIDSSGSNAQQLHRRRDRYDRSEKARRRRHRRQRQKDEHELKRRKRERKQQKRRRSRKRERDNEGKDGNDEETQPSDDSDDLDSVSGDTVDSLLITNTKRRRLA